MTMATSSSERTPLIRKSIDDEDTQKKIDDGSSNDILSNWGIFVALIFTWIGSMLAALDSTITTTLSATIASDFNSLTIISWLGTAYLIAVAVSQPLIGKLSDIFGRRQSLIVCSLVFGIGNTVCGLATTEAGIIFGRFAAGVGAGGLNAIASFVATDLVPTRQRGVWYGLSMLVFGVGLGFGGIVGGGLNDLVGWRWAFLSLTPITIFSTIGVYFCVPNPAEKKSASVMDQVRRIDFLGAFLLVSALSLFLWVLSSDEDTNTSSTTITVTLIMSAFLFAGFIAVEIRFAVEPILLLHLLRDRTVTSSSLTGFFNSMAFFTLSYYVPLYFQVQGSTPTEAGVQIVPQSVGVALGSLSVGILMRSTGYCGNIKIAVIAVSVAAAFGFFISNLGTSMVFPEFYLFLNGVGFVGMLTTTLTALICSVDRRDQAVATSLSLLFRGTGSTVGLAMSSKLFRRVLEQQMQGIEAPSDGSKYDLDRCVVGARDCPYAVLEAYMTALHATFLFAFVLVLMALFTSFFMKTYKLSSQHVESTKKDDLEA